MWDKISDVPDSVKTYLWLLLVALIGSLVGFITKTLKTLSGQSLLAKIRVLFASMLSSMFIAYIVFEVLSATIQRQGLVVAVSGFAAYIGTDLLIIMQERLIEKIKNKIDRL